MSNNRHPSDVQASIAAEKKVEKEAFDAAVVDNAESEQIAAEQKARAELLARKVPELVQQRALANGARDASKEADSAAGSERSSAVVPSTSAAASVAAAAAAAAAAFKAESACRVRRSRLGVTLERLRATLQAMPADTRQGSILRLDARVRVALLEFMQVRAVSARQENMLKAAGRSSKRGLAKKSQKVARAPARAGEARVHRGRGGMYRAKICIDGITLYGRYSSLEAAEKQQRTLAELRSLVMKELATPSQERCEAPFRSSFVRAVEELAKKDMSLNEAGIHVYLSLHVARWLGSVHVTSPVVSVEEALLLREALLQAKDEGWQAFRRAWLDLLHHQERQKLRPGHKCPLWAEAEQRVDGVYQRNAAKRSSALSLLDLGPAKLRAVGGPVRPRRACTQSLQPHAVLQLKAERLEQRLIQSVFAVQRALDSLARHVTRKKRTSRVNRKLQRARQRNPAHS